MFGILEHFKKHARTRSLLHNQWNRKQKQFLKQILLFKHSSEQSVISKLKLLSLRFFSKLTGLSSFSPRKHCFPFLFTEHFYSLKTAIIRYQRNNAINTVIDEIVFATGQKSVKENYQLSILLG